MNFFVKILPDYHVWLAAFPWKSAAVTAVLFAATVAASRLTKRFIDRRAARSSPDGFWKPFWDSERSFVLKCVGFVFWALFAAAALYIWFSHIGKVVDRVEHLAPPLIRGVLIAAIAAAALKASRILIRVFVERGKSLAGATPRGAQRMQTLEHVFRYFTAIAIFFLAALMLLNNFGIDLAALLATVGVASLAIGFGAQSLVKDVLAGIFILTEDQFAVGDVVVLNGEGGLVERVTLRITQLRNTEGTLITVPNGSITNVKNMSSEWSRVDYKIGVAYGTDLDRCMRVLMDEAIKLAADIPDKIFGEPEAMGVDEFGDSAVTLRVWIKTRPLMQWAVRREYNRRIHIRFAKEGIEIPFPQRTLWLKEPSESALLESLAARRG